VGIDEVGPAGPLVQSDAVILGRLGAEQVDSLRVKKSQASTSGEEKGGENTLDIHPDLREGVGQGEGPAADLPAEMSAR